MKSSKRTIALFMTLIFALTSVFSISATVAGAADFSDVTNANAYYEAITSLVGSGVINGYEDGTFKPDNTITRAEFSKILATASAPSGTQFNATTTQFSDVADSTSSSAWAIPYIAYAVGVKAVNGYEDGTFRPTNTVTYGEAVKMIVCTLGYDPVVDKTLTPWYQGYIDVANQIGLTKNAVALGDAPAPRGLVAQLSYNMLSCNVLTQTGTDINGNPIYSTTGTSGAGTTIIEQNDNATQGEGVVLGVLDYSLTGQAVKNTEVLIDTVLYKLGSYDRETLKSYVGYHVEFMFNAKNEITRISKTSSNELTTVKDWQIANVTNTGISYYADEDAEYDNKTTNINFNNMYIVYNGEIVTQAQLSGGFDIATYLNVEDGSITFLSNDGNPKSAEVAIVESYVTYFAEQSSTTNNTTTISDQYPLVSGLSDIAVSKLPDGAVKKVTSKGGSASNSTASSISKNSVVSIAVPFAGATENTKIIYSTATVTDTIDEFTSYDNFVMNNVTYEVAPYFTKLLNANKVPSFEQGSSGKFYLDYSGRVVFYERSTTNNPYVLAVRYYKASSGVDEVYNLDVVEKGKSGFITYTLNNTVKLNNQSQAVTAIEALTHLKNNSPKSYTGDLDGYIIQPVRLYKNTSGKINAIDCMDSNNDYEDGNIAPYKFKNNVNTSAAYFANGGVLKYSSSGFKNGTETQFSTAKATLFVVPLDVTKENQYMTSYSFDTSSSYCVESYDVENRVAGAAIFYAAESTLPKVYTNTPVSIIKEISYVPGDDGATVASIKYYDVGSTSVQTKTTDVELELNGLSSVDDLSVGDMVKFAGTGSKITRIDAVYVNGVLSRVTAPSGAGFVGSDGNRISQDYPSAASDEQAGYYQVIRGTINDFDTDINLFEIIPGKSGEAGFDYNVNNEVIVEFPAPSSSTVYYKLHNGELVTVEYSDYATKTYVKNAATASVVIAVKMGSITKGLYLIP